MTSLNTDGHLANVRFIPQYERALRRAIQRYQTALPNFAEPDFSGLSLEEQLNEWNKYYNELQSSLQTVQDASKRLEDVQGVWRSAISDPELGSLAADQYAAVMNSFLEEHVDPVEEEMPAMEAKLRQSLSEADRQYKAVEARIKNSESTPPQDDQTSADQSAFATPLGAKTVSRTVLRREAPAAPTISFEGEDGQVASTSAQRNGPVNEVIHPRVLRRATTQTREGSNESTLVLLDKNGRAVDRTQAWVTGNFKRPDLTVEDPAVVAFGRSSAPPTVNRPETAPPHHAAQK